MENFIIKFIVIILKNPNAGNPLHLDYKSLLSFKK